VVVTGGAGFLGSCVVRELCRRGASEVFIPRSRDYNLTTVEAVGRLYRDAHPHVVIHLAARVGGIGANRANPGKFFYENLVMGALLMEYARRHEVALPQRQVLGHPVGGEQNAGKLPR
jgi:GDP-L-fucose synthase